MRRKVLLVGVLILAMLLQLFLPFTTAKAASSVEITLNSKLYEAIKSQLEEQGIEASYYDANGKIIITESELAKVTELNLQSKEIEDLTNISKFSSLKYLNLTANMIVAKDSEGQPCNLGELNNLPNIERINLSSNRLENVDAIRGLIDNSSIAIDITNQTTIGKGILKAKYPTTISTVELPRILAEDKDLIPSDGIILETLNTDGTISTFDRSRASFHDETELDIEIAYISPNDIDGDGEGNDYVSYNDLLKLTVSYTEQYDNNNQYANSVLSGTVMTFYYAIVGEDETGIIFNDENLYYAIKNQLEEGQTINEEIKEYTDEATLYDRAYDIPLILVIKDNVLINQISSLILNDREIKDLTGIEEFVGLETYLNVSYNYIGSIEKIVKLEENKTTKERELQEKYSDILRNLKTVRTNIQTLEGKLELLETLEDQLAEANALGNAELATQIQNQLDSDFWPYEDGWRNALYGDGTTSGLYYIESILLEKLYNTYEKEFRITSILSYEESMLTYDEIYEMRTNETSLRSHYNAIINRIREMEENGILFNKEISIIKQEFGITSTSDTAISEFFANKQDMINYGALTGSQLLNYYYQTIISFKNLHIECLAYNYCLIERMYNPTISDCVCAQGIAEIRDYLVYNGLDTHFVHAFTCGGSTALEETGNSLEFKLAGRLAYGEEDIARYFILKRLQELNIENNQIESLNDIGQLTKLKMLEARQNLVNDISEVVWPNLTLLVYLDLGYNQISNIKPLEALTSLMVLQLDSNLISGPFDFDTVNMTNLGFANFANNQITDLTGLFLQSQSLAWPNGYSSGEEYFKEELMGIYNFQGQYLTINTTAIKTGDFITVDLPPIFAQFERIDSLRTSFGIDSWFGLVYADGTKVKLRTPATGNYSAMVTVEGDNGYDEHSTEGMGYGSVCNINYTIIEDTVVDEPTDPDDTPYVIPDLEYGYTIENDYIVIYTPGISLDEFKNTLVPEGYTVEVAQNPSQNIATGSVVTIYQGEEVIALIEVVVKGDVNGDGIVNGTDSGIIRGIRDDVTPQPEGVYFKAADVNNNNKINTSDYVAVLQYRADFISSFEDL